MCDCIDLINAKLKDADINTMLDIPIAWSMDRINTKGVLIATKKRDKSNRKKPSSLFASYCPFCGQSYALEGQPQPPKPTAGEAAAERNLNEALDMIRDLVEGWPLGEPPAVVDAARKMLLDKIHGGTGREEVDDE